MANDALMRFGRTLKLVSDRFGEYHKYLVQEVVITSGTSETQEAQGPQGGVVVDC